MPPAPQDPQGDPTKSPPAQESGAKNPFDLGKILLPKKETPGQTPQSAERINAGALLEQEQHATLAPQTPPEPPKPAVPLSTPASPPEETTVKPIETYQRDIESLVKDKNVSVLSIATAEAERRSSQQADMQPEAVSVYKRLQFKTIGLYALGFVLLVAASGALAYIIERPTSVPPTVAANAPFIAVDGTKDITISADTSRASLMASLTAAKESAALSLGLISRLVVTVATTTPAGQILLPVDAQSFFTLLAPDIPAALLRTINPSYLLGVHIYQNNEPFIIMSVDSYEQAYAGMLAWEPDMQQDLEPLFTMPVPIHIPEEGLSSTTQNPDSQFIQTGFVDSIVENHDARVIQNGTGDISLLWTFLDRNTLVITTNTATVREIISRLKEAPITSVPAQ